ncbi:hypothetical protein Tco_0718804 [Tanacetum coccineum]
MVTGWRSGDDDGFRGDGGGGEMKKVVGGRETTMVVDQWWSVAWDGVGVAERRHVSETWPESGRKNGRRRK